MNKNIFSELAKDDGSHDDAEEVLSSERKPADEIPGRRPTRAGEAEAAVWGGTWREPARSPKTEKEKYRLKNKSVKYMYTSANSIGDYYTCLGLNLFY